MPHTIRPKRYLVEMTDAELVPRTFEVRVIAADILKAEDIAPSYGISGARNPIALTLLWIWAAAMREGKADLSWPEFRSCLVDWLDLARATEVEDEPVDPTRPGAPMTSPSSSPSDSPPSTITAGNTPSPPTPA